MAREQLAGRCEPLVRSIAREYQHRGAEHDDPVQAGMVGLVKAIDRFDPDAGHRFVSFAVPDIQGEIRRHFRDATWAVHVPRSMQELDQKVHARATIEHAMEPLDDRARAVVRMRYDEGLLQREIAPRVGVSQMQISRILSSALETMHRQAAVRPPVRRAA